MDIYTVTVEWEWGETGFEVFETLDDAIEDAKKIIAQKDDHRCSTPKSVLVNKGPFGCHNFEDIFYWTLGNGVEIEEIDINLPQYPEDFFEFGKSAVVPEETILKWIEEVRQKVKCEGEDSWMIRSGDAMVFCQNLGNVIETYVVRGYFCHTELI